MYFLRNGLAKQLLYAPSTRRRGSNKTRKRQQQEEIWFLTAVLVIGKFVVKCLTWLIINIPSTYLQVLDICSINMNEEASNLNTGLAS